MAPAASTLDLSRWCLRRRGPARARGRRRQPTAAAAGRGRRRACGGAAAGALAATLARPWAAQAAQQQQQRLVSEDGGFELMVPGSFLVAANRAVAGASRAQTLAIATDLRRKAVLSVRQEPVPAALRALLDETTAPTAEQVARALTAPLADAVAQGEAKAAVGGVLYGESGTVGFSLDGWDAGLRAQRPYFSLAYTAEVCRGKIGAEGMGGRLSCDAPDGKGPLPTIRRRSRCVSALRKGMVLTLRASAEERVWDDDQFDREVDEALSSFLLLSD